MVVVMVNVVKVMIQKRVLIECRQYDLFALFCNLIFHIVTLTEHSCNTSLMVKVHSRQQSSIISHHDNLITWRYFTLYCSSKDFPDIWCLW